MLKSIRPVSIFKGIKNTFYLYYFSKNTGVRLQIKESDTVVRSHNCKIFIYFAKYNGRACITFGKSQSLLEEKFRHELFEKAFPE